MIIGLVGAIDVYWSIKTADHLNENELNPVGRWLIKFDNGSVATFMGIKVFTMTLALGILILLRKYKHGWIVTTALLIFQFWLLCFFYRHP